MLGAVARRILCTLISAALLFAQRSPSSNLRSLYESGKWAELVDALPAKGGFELYRGAIAVSFHQDSTQAEAYLRSIIRSAPKSTQAYEAYEWLSHLFLYCGHYAQFVATMEARWSAFPDKPEEKQERAVVAGFRGLPDQVTLSVSPSTLRHEDQSIFIPVSVNGNDATFFFDTGAWPNVMSESEAKRLGL